MSKNKELQIAALRWVIRKELSDSGCKTIYFEDSFDLVDYPMTVTSLVGDCLQNENKSKTLSSLNSVKDLQIVLRNVILELCKEM